MLLINFPLKYFVVSYKPNLYFTNKFVTRYLHLDIDQFTIIKIKRSSRYRYCESLKYSQGQCCNVVQSFACDIFPKDFTFLFGINFLFFNIYYKCAWSQIYFSFLIRRYRSVKCQCQTLRSIVFSGLVSQTIYYVICWPFFSVFCLLNFGRHFCRLI